MYKYICMYMRVRAFLRVFRHSLFLCLLAFVLVGFWKTCSGRWSLRPNIGSITDDTILARMKVLTHFTVWKISHPANQNQSFKTVSPKPKPSFSTLRTPPVLASPEPKSLNFLSPTWKQASSGGQNCGFESGQKLKIKGGDCWRWQLSSLLVLKKSSW